MQFLRFGRAAVITADFGSNYSGAKKSIETTEDSLDDKEVRGISVGLQSTGTKLVQRCPMDGWFITKQHKLQELFFSTYYIIFICKIK